MTKSYEELQAICRDLVSEFGITIVPLISGEDTPEIQGIFVTTLWGIEMMKPGVPSFTTGEDLEKYLESVKGKIRRMGDDPDEWVIMVPLTRALPEECKLPDVYKGVKIFSPVVGEQDFLYRETD